MTGIHLLDEFAPEDVVFIHNPRTGGMSVCDATGLYQSHEPHWRRQRHYAFGFTVLRDPWEQALSWYVSANIADQFGMTLDEWAEAGFPVGDYHAHCTLSPDKQPWWMVCHPFDQLGRAGTHLNAYYRFEDRADWWPTLTAKPLPHLNRSRPEGRPVVTQHFVNEIAATNTELIGLYHYKAPEVV